MAKNKSSSGLSDKDIANLRKALGSKKEDSGSQAFDVARQVRMEKGLMAAIKAFNDINKKEKIATTGIKTGKGDFFRGAGFSEIGDLVEMMFDKKASKEEQEAAQKELGMKTSKKGKSGGSGGGGFSFSTSKQLLKRFKTVQDSIAGISEDVKYIKDRVAPKVMNTKEEGGKGSKQVIFDPLGPHGNQFRQINKTPTGHITGNVHEKHIKSATTQAANLGGKTLKATGSIGKPQAKKASGKLGKAMSKPKATTGALAKAMPAAAPKFVDPTEKSPFDDDISKALGAGSDPITSMHKEMTASFNKVFLKLSDSGDSPGILDMIGMVKSFAPILKMVGGVLGPMAAVGAAGFIGYEVGNWLNDKFKLSDKLLEGVDKIKGWFGASDKDKADATAAEDKKRQDDRNAKVDTALKDTGWTRKGVEYTGPNGEKVKGYGSLPQEVSSKVYNALGKTPPPPAATPTPTAPPAAASTPAPTPTPPPPAPTPTPAPAPAPAPAATPSASTKSTGTGTLSTGGGDAVAKNMIKRHEGVRYKPYKDSLGLWTIGVGHLIGDGKSLPPEYNREFSAEEVDQLFNKDFEHHQDAAEKIPGYDKIDNKGQAALTDLTFNMGPTWYKKWKNFSKSMAAGDVEGAANNLESSKWYGQVGSRAPEVVAMLRNSSDDTSSGISGLMNSNGNDRSSAVSEGKVSASAATPTAPRTAGSVTPTMASSGAAIDTGSKSAEAGKAAAMQPSSPIIMASSGGAAPAAKTPPSQALPSANPRSSESAFGRALAKDFSHPTAFTTIGTV